MTYRQRMLAVLKGKESDRIPWCPRMDLWQIANNARGTLPDRFAGMNTVQLAGALGIGCHAVQADYTTPDAAENLALRGFGFHNRPEFPYRVELEGLPLEFQATANGYVTRIRTRSGTVTVRQRETPEMKQEGITLPFIDSYPIMSPEDLEAVGEVFEHLVVVPTPEGYAAFQRRVGESGLAIARGVTAASPVHLMLHDLMPMQRFFELYMDDPKAVHRLAERMEPFYDAVLEAAVSCSAEIVTWGANFDSEITYPPFFEQEILPWLRKACRRIHEAGKLVECHLDGENERLFDLYRQADFDVAESVCTRPMVKNSLKEIRQQMGRKKTIWGGLPSVALLTSSMSDSVFERFLNEVFSELGAGDHLIFGVSDNVPPNASLERLERITERIERFGPVKAAS